MSRSRSKGPFVDERLMKKVERLRAEGRRDPIRTWSRACVIAPEFVGITFEVHNGKKFIPVAVTEAMVGHRLGEFSPTRTFRAHGEAHTKEALEKT